MISLGMAIKLKEAGLVWTPALHDFFTIPERGIDDRVFVISDIQASIENLFGSPVVAFQGASEWALDYLVTTEAVWLPSEEQLRLLVEDHLLSYRQSSLSVTWSLSYRYGLKIVLADAQLEFQGPDASSVYTQALLYFLEHEHPPVQG